MENKCPEGTQLLLIHMQLYPTLTAKETPHKKIQKPYKNQRNRGTGDTYYLLDS